MEDFHGEGAFDLVSMRMVAEHVTDPDRFAASVARALKRDGRAVVYTVYGYSPVPLITRLIPFRLHNPVKRLFWGTQPKDSFPTAFRMNTRTALRELFGRHDMAEEAFMYLDDCRSLSGFRAGHWTELALWRTLSALGLPYPERCLLGVYKKG
jgi:SAM-dependent methyltransferase